MARTLIRDIFQNANEKEQYLVKGWVYRKTDLGKKSFLMVRDRSGSIQTVLGNKENANSLYDSINVGDVIALKGNVKEDNRAPNGKEINIEHLEIVNPCQQPAPFPLDHMEERETLPDLNIRLDYRYLDLRNKNVSDIFRVKSKTASSLREHLEENDFIEIQTPKIVASATEGGTNLFPIEYFEKDAFLAQSPQFYKQMMMASGLERVFEIAPCFRAERHGTTSHLNEFTSVDFEMAFIKNEEDVMKMAEKVLSSTMNDLKEYGKKINLEKQITVPQSPFPRIKMEEAYSILENNGISVEIGEDVGPNGEKILGDHVKKSNNSEIFFLTEYPKESRPLYTMPHEEKPEYTRSFDIIFKGTEIISGGQRIHEHKMLEDAFEKKGIDTKDYGFYVDTFKYGMPPHGGLGLGLDRFVYKMLDLENIREAVLFPRDKNRITP